MRLTGRNCGKILCDGCRQPLRSDLNGVAGTVTCQICGSQYEGAFFAVADRFRQHRSLAVSAQQQHDAQCFFHPGRQALAICASCGRMLCALCDIEQSAAHTCPRCLNDQRAGGLSSAQRSSLAYTQIAWGLLLLAFVVPFIPALAGAGFAVAGIRNRDYCNSLGRKLSLAAVVLLASLALGVVPLLIYWGMVL